MYLLYSNYYFLGGNSKIKTLYIITYLVIGIDNINLFAIKG